MRLKLWIVFFVSALAGVSFGYYSYRQSHLIARPAYIEEFELEAKERIQESSLSMIPESNLNADLDDECAHLKNIDWEGILSNHTFLNGLRREEIKADTVWTLKLSLLAFLGMEYDIFEIENITADSVTYHRIEYGDISESLHKSETQLFEHFRQQACGVNRVHPLLYVASDLGQVALPMPNEFVDRFMNQAEFRILMGQRINKRFRININQSNWTIEAFLELMEQP